MRSHSKCQSHVHSRGIALHRSINKTVDLCKCNNFIEFSPNLRARHPKNCAVEKYVFPSRELGMKARSNFEKARHASIEYNASLTWLGDTAENFKERALACPISANDSQNFALFNFEANIS